MKKAKKMKAKLIEDLLKEGDEWESGKRGMAFKRASLEDERRLDKALGLQMISIRLPIKLIEQLKELAEQSGIGYQPYIRQLLSEHTRHDVDQIQQIKKGIQNIENLIKKKLG